MDNRKNLIKIISVAIIIVIIILLLIISINSANNEDEKSELSQEQNEYLNSIENPGMAINGQKPTELKIDNLYFTIEACIKSYFEYIQNEDSQTVYNILNKQYIEDNEISNQNVITKIPKYENSENYRIDTIYVISGPNYGTYYVSGTIENNEVFLIVNLDSSTNCFDIIPSTKNEYNENINKTVETSQKHENIIEKNNSNTISYKYYTEEDIVSKYFQKYLEEALYNPEEAFNSLDENYRKTKFGNIDNYKNYINQNKDKLELMCNKARKKYTDFDNYEDYEKYFAQVNANGLEKYQIEQKDTYKQYTCIDTNGKYYIFKVTNIMKYTLILDTYTIDLPEFVEQYEKASEEDKVLMNIQKFFDAIEDKDYDYAYDKLDATFKSNNFATLESFENYVNENFFEENTLSAGKPEKQGDVYLYNVTIDDGTGESNNSRTTSFVMRLGEGTDFVMSFGI